MANIYVMDTSVLMSNPGAVKKARWHGVVIPTVVLRQLDGLKNNKDVHTAYMARKASQAIEKQQAKGNLLIVSEHAYVSKLPNSADNEIIGTAIWMTTNYHRYCVGKVKHIVVVSTDRNMRIAAVHFGLKAENDAGTTVDNVLLKLALVSGAMSAFAFISIIFYAYIESYLAKNYYHLNLFLSNNVMIWAGPVMAAGFVFAFLFAGLSGVFGEQHTGNHQATSHEEQLICNPAFSYLSYNIYHKNRKNTYHRLKW